MYLRCKIKKIRQGILQILQIIMENIMETYEKLNQELQREQNLNANSKELKKIHNKLDFLREFIDSIFSDIIIKRLNDIRQEVRNYALEILVNN